jgi:diacylglycerol kinase family enzyme
VPPTPVFLNASAGGAGPVLQVLRADPRVTVRDTPPERLAAALEDAAAPGASVVVAGGDGTLSAAAGVLAGSETVLGVIPAGTLNHFAHDHGLPMDPAPALEVALAGRAERVDVASVNGRVFLNTCAVGAYPAFVRIRERWTRLGYHGASLAAAAATFTRLRAFDLELEADGRVRRFRTPLVFVGVGERELRPPRPGARREGGRRALHVLVVLPTGRLRLLWMALRTVLGGIRPWAGGGEVESLLVERCSISLASAGGWMALDGEIVPSRGVLAFSHLRDALALRVPAHRVS